MEEQEELVEQRLRRSDLRIGTPEQHEELFDQGLRRSDRRARTPERSAPQKRRGGRDKDSPGKRFIVGDTGSDQDEADEANEAPVFDMQFEDTMGDQPA